MCAGGVRDADAAPTVSYYYRTVSLTHDSGSDPVMKFFNISATRIRHVYAALINYDPATPGEFSIPC